MRAPWILCTDPDDDSPDTDAPTPPAPAPEDDHAGRR